MIYNQEKALKHSQRIRKERYLGAIAQTIAIWGKELRYQDDEEAKKGLQELVYFYNNVREQEEE